MEWKGKKNRVKEGIRVTGIEREIEKKMSIPKEIKVALFETICLPSVMYELENMDWKFLRRRD